MSCKPRNNGTGIAVNAGMITPETEAEASAEAASRPLEEALDDRIRSITDWLREAAPDIGDEQRHLDEGGAEAAYWHYGYLMALRDVRRLLSGPRSH